MTADWDYARFVERLTASSDAVFAFAKAVHRKGHAVEIPAITIAPTAEQTSDFKDDGDLFVDGYHRVEVKGINRDFTCADDWPWPHFWLSNARAVERCWGKVAAYVLVNKTLTHAGIAYGNTKESWYILDKFMQNTQRIERSYYCPLELVKFIKLVGE